MSNPNKVPPRQDFVKAGKGGSMIAYLIFVAMILFCVCLVKAFKKEGKKPKKADGPPIVLGGIRAKPPEMDTEKILIPVYLTDMRETEARHIRSEINRVCRQINFVEKTRGCVPLALLRKCEDMVRDYRRLERERWKAEHGVNGSGWDGNVDTLRFFTVKNLLEAVSENEEN